MRNPLRSEAEAYRFLIVSIGVAALYIARIFEQVKGRPLFVVSRRIAHGVEQ